MKQSRGKLLPSIITVALCSIAFVLLFYTERITLLSSTSIFNRTSCSRRNVALKSSEFDDLLLHVNMLH